MTFTADEIETIKELIEDWGFEYSLKANPDKVFALAEKIHWLCVAETDG